MVEVASSNLAGPTKHERARCKRAFLCLKGPHSRAGEASRKARPLERLIRRSKAQAPEGFNRQSQWRLKTSWLVRLIK